LIMISCFPVSPLDGFPTRAASPASGFFPARSKKSGAFSREKVIFSFSLSEALIAYRYDFATDALFTGSVVIVGGPFPVPTSSVYCWVVDSSPAVATILIVYSPDFPAGGVPVNVAVPVLGSEFDRESHPGPEA